MLLKKIQSKFIPLKKRKKGSKATTALPLGRKGRFGFSLYMAAVLALCCFPFLPLPLPTRWAW